MYPLFKIHPIIRDKFLMSEGYLIVKKTENPQKIFADKKIFCGQKIFFGQNSACSTINCLLLAFFFPHFTTKKHMFDSFTSFRQSVS